MYLGLLHSVENMRVYADARPQTQARVGPLTHPRLPWACACACLCACACALVCGLPYAGMDM
jgi:hypothetical protein